MGGQPGLAGTYSLNREAVDATPRMLNPGDTYMMRLPGGGGYGDPHLRRIEQVTTDLLSGYVSAEKAASEYGVRLDSDGRAYRV